MSGARYSAEVTTLGQAWREFARKPSPWLIGLAFAIVLALRVLDGGELTWRDGVAVAAMLVIYPFGEWAIHVYLLHMRPAKVGGRKIDLPVAKAHRAHHRKPNDLTMILLDGRELSLLLFLAVPFVIAVGALLVGLVFGALPVGPLLCAVLAGYAAIGIYEWTHFLIHTAHLPRSRYYKAIWRNHRLHHFKNEHFWHGITNNVSDRVLRTNPDQRSVERRRRPGTSTSARVSPIPARSGRRSALARGRTPRGER